MKKNGSWKGLLAGLLCGSAWVLTGCSTVSLEMEPPESSASFTVKPTDLPNRGILFVDHEAEGRSGHGGNTVVEAANGDLLAFYSNVSGSEFHKGHSVAGWSEYKRSVDGGKTWSEAKVFPYSKATWEADAVFSALVVTVNKTANGNLIAILARFADAGWNKQSPPVYFVSADNGESWQGPRELDPDATVEEVSITYNGSFVCPETGTFYVVCIGGVEAMCPGPYSLYASTDNGATFERRSVLPFNHKFNYGTGQVLDDGSIIVYAYPFQGLDGSDDQTGTPAERTDEHNMPYVISHDEGRTWSSPQSAYFAKRLRNGQMSAKVDGLYFMHGRSGLYGDAPRNLVLYSSTDGVHWDDGMVLKKNSRLDGDAYSANAVVGRQDPATPERLLIQSSVAYDGRFRVNSCQWWVEDISVNSKRND